MWVVEPEVQRCGSRLPRDVLWWGSTRTGDCSCDLPAAQRGLAQRAEFKSVDATAQLPFSDDSFDAITCIDAINHFPDRPRVIAECRRLLKPGGQLLFTDPITLTGPLTNAEVAVRSSAGFYLFVPRGYDENLIAQYGLQVQVCQDVTANMAKVAEARRAARASRGTALRSIEGDQAYESKQAYFYLTDRPSQARWLPEDERNWLVNELQVDLQAKSKIRNYTIPQAFCDLRILRLILAYFLALTGALGTIYWIPTFLKRLSGFPTHRDFAPPDSSSDGHCRNAPQRLALR